MTNEQLVIQIKAGINTAQNMNQLWQQNQGIIGKIACKYRGYEDLEDLKQQGFLGLCDAVEGYHPEEGIPFVNYAAFWIRQSIQRYLENCCCIVRIPVHASEKVRAYRKACSQFEKWYGRKATEREISRILGVNEKSIEQIKKDAKMKQIASLDSPLTAAGDTEEITVGEMVAAAGDLEEEVVDRIQQEELKKTIWQVVDSLPEKQAVLIKERYQEGKTLSALAQELGITLEAVRQQEKKAMRELRKPSRSRRLSHFLGDGMIYNKALHGNGVGTFRRTWTSSTERIVIETLG